MDDDAAGDDAAAIGDPVVGTTSLEVVVNVLPLLINTESF